MEDQKDQTQSEDKGETEDQLQNQNNQLQIQDQNNQLQDKKPQFQIQNDQLQNQDKKPQLEIQNKFKHLTPKKIIICNNIPQSCVIQHYQGSIQRLLCFEGYHCQTEKHRLKYIHKIMIHDHCDSFKILTSGYYWDPCLWLSVALFKNKIFAYIQELINSSEDRTIIESSYYHLLLKAHANYKLKLISTSRYHHILQLKDKVLGWDNISQILTEEQLLIEASLYYDDLQAFPFNSKILPYELIITQGAYNIYSKIDQVRMVNYFCNYHSFPSINERSYLNFSKQDNIYQIAIDLWKKPNTKIYNQIRSIVLSLLIRACYYNVITYSSLWNFLNIYSDRRYVKIENQYILDIGLGTSFSHRAKYNYYTHVIVNKQESAFHNFLFELCIKIHDTEMKFWYFQFDKKENHEKFL